MINTLVIVHLIKYAGWKQTVLFYVKNIFLIIPRHGLYLLSSSC